MLTAWGRVAMLVATLGWAAVAAAQPANDDCANATVVTALPFSDLGVDMTTATTEAGDPVSACGGQGTNSVWYRIPAGSDATLLRGLVAGTGTDYGVRAWTGSCGALVELECQYVDDFFTEFGFAAEGQEYLVEIVNLATAGTLDLTLDVFPEFLIAKGGSRRNAIGGGPGGFLVGIPKFPVAEGRLYDPAGSSLGAAFPLGDISWPFDVAGAGDGSFFVVGDSAGAEAVRVDGVGTVTELAGVSAGSYSKVAADAAGNFVVVWGNAPVVAQRYDRDGVPQGGLIQATAFGDYPTVAMAPSGDFVVTWTGDDGDDEGIEAQRFDASGSPVGPAFVVNSYTTGYQDASAVGMDAAGNFVVAWEHGGYRYFPGEGGFDEPVVARRFSAAGTPLGPDFVVSDSPDYYGITSYIQVAMAGGGEFMVTWEGFGFTVVDIHARRFASDGTPAGSEFFVNTFQSGYSSYDPDVAATPAGDFMVAWNDYYGFFGGNAPPEYETEATLARVFPAAGSGCAATAKTGCRTPTIPLKSKLLLLDAPDALHDQLRWKFVKGDATDVNDLGDPTTDEDYVLCMYDASSPGGALLMENRIPAGGTCGTKPCWKGLGNPAGSKGYRYKDNDRTPHGVQKMVLKPGAAGKSKVVIKGGQDHVFTGGPGAPALPLALPVTVQLQNASGTCWQATYDTAGVGANETGFFKGSGS